MQSPSSPVPQTPSIDSTVGSAGGSCDPPMETCDPTKLRRAKMFNRQTTIECFDVSSNCGLHNDHATCSASTLFILIMCISPGAYKHEGAMLRL